MQASSKQQKSSMHTHAKAASAGPNGIAAVAKTEGDAGVYSNTAEPMQLDTLASLQESDIQVVPGANVIQQKQGQGMSTFQFIDHRPEAKQAAQLQAMADRNSNFVIQRKPLNPNVLNVVGENHDIPDELRRWEAEYATVVAGGPYWQENEFKTNIAKPGGAVGETVSAFGDSKILQMANIIHFSTKALLDITKLLKEIPTVTVNLSNLSASKNKVYRTANLINVHLPKLKAFEPVYKKLKPEAQAELPDRPNLAETCNLYIEVGDVFYGAFLTGIDQWVSSTLAVNQSAARPAHLNNAVQTGRPFIATGNELINKIFKKEDVSDLEDQQGKDNMIFRRSEIMHATATTGKDTKGVWKIGNTHVSDIKRILAGTNPTYELMTENEYVADLETWLPEYPVYQAYEYGLELADMYDWSKSTVFKLAKKGHFNEMIQVRRREAATRRDSTPSYIS